MAILFSIRFHFAITTEKRKYCIAFRTVCQRMQDHMTHELPTLRYRPDAAHFRSQNPQIRVSLQLLYSTLFVCEVISYYETDRALLGCFFADICP